MSLRSHRASHRAAVPLLGLAAAALLAGPASAAPLDTATAPAVAVAAPDAPCADGVVVVVDLTDIGGEVEVGCAAGTPASGTEALRAAGFTDTRDAAGMICAIDGHPDPCPETFEGVFWAYWSADRGGEWQMATEGSDTAQPVAGQVEGWRYNDGATGPSLSPADAIERLAAGEGSGPTSGGGAVAEDAPTSDAKAGDATAQATPAQDAGEATGAQDDDGSAAPVLIGVAAVVVLLGVLLAVRARRSTGPDA